jgi:hypothetical protein
MAKELLNYEPVISSNEEENTNKADVKSLFSDTNGEPETKTVHHVKEDYDEDDDNNQLRSSIDDKNFYRNFTLKFHLLHQNQPDETQTTDDFAIRKNKLFNIEHNHIDAPNENVNEVNLTSFIMMYKFHFDLIALIRGLVCSSSSNQHNHVFSMIGLLKCFNQTYIATLKLDYVFSFKILLSKIFYLNCESSLANFINLTNQSFLAIIHLMFNHCWNKVRIFWLFYNSIYEGLFCL